MLIAYVVRLCHCLSVLLFVAIVIVLALFNHRSFARWNRKFAVVPAHVRSWYTCFADGSFVGYSCFCSYCYRYCCLGQSLMALPTRPKWRRIVLAGFRLARVRLNALPDTVTWSLRSRV